MISPDSLSLFAVCAPGLEGVVAEELRTIGVRNIATLAGGVSFSGDWSTLIRANLRLRCATRILMRVESFAVAHLSQLHKRTRRIEWERILPADLPVRIKTTCRRSRIYHSAAATERVYRAIEERTGLRPADQISGPASLLLVRLDDNLCTISLDSSGEPLYRRGYKLETSAAPLRETLAAGFLSLCRYQGQEIFLDPMCGSGSFVLEAALISLRRAVGLHRSFSFQHWPGFLKQRWDGELSECRQDERAQPEAPLFATDQNQGAVQITRRNLERANLDQLVTVRRQSIAELEAPAESGLILCNPPYGKRLQPERSLKKLYSGLGRMVRDRFKKWRVGVVTNQRRLAEATGLSFSWVSPPIPHGGIRVTLFLYEGEDVGVRKIETTEDPNRGCQPKE